MHAVRAEAGQLGGFVAALFESGRIIDFILAFVAVEAVLLIAYARRVGIGMPLGDVIVCILPGVMLMLALRGALAEAGWPWIALCLVGALAGHLADLRRRLRAVGYRSGRGGDD